MNRPRPREIYVGQASRHGDIPESREVTLSGDVREEFRFKPLSSLTPLYSQVDKFYRKWGSDWHERRRQVQN